MAADDLFDVLDEAVADAARLLAAKVKEGTATAADITQLRAMYKEAGGTLAFGGKPTSTGDHILDSMSDVDPSLLN